MAAMQVGGDNVIINGDLHITISHTESKRITTDAQKQSLNTVVEILVKVHSSLKAAFSKGIAVARIPVLLVKQPCSLVDLKSNIDKYLQFAFMQNPQGKLKYQMWAYQYVSDYCVGHSFSDAQLDNFLTAKGDDAVNIARAVWAFCKKYDVSRTNVRHLFDSCAAHRGSVAVDDDFADDSGF